MGGAFTAIGRPSGPLATFSAADGSVRQTFPQIGDLPFPHQPSFYPQPINTDVRALAAEVTVRAGVAREVHVALTRRARRRRLAAVL